MAITVYKSGAQMVRKYESINADFPSKGVHVADTPSIGIYNPASNAADVIVTITYDSPEAIEADTATWLAYQTITAGNDAHIVMEYGPVGIKITTTGSTAVAWIKS